MDDILSLQRGRRFVEPHNMEQLITVQFKWGRELKTVSTRYYSSPVLLRLTYTPAHTCIRVLSSRRQSGRRESRV